MVEARIRVELPDECWKAAVSRDHADVSFHLLGTVLNGGNGVETLVVSGCTPEECFKQIETHGDIENAEIIEHKQNELTVQVETAEPVVHATAVEAGVPLVYPAKLQSGELTTTVVGTHTAISSLGEEFEDRNLEFEVAHVHSDHELSRVFTDRQREVFFTAVEHGYYRNPRQCTVTELADILGIAKSTCSGTLQRAEAAVVEQFCLRQQFPGEGSKQHTHAGSHSSS